MEREAWRRPALHPGDCIAGVPAGILERYAEEGPELERGGELPAVPEPAADDFETPKRRAQQRRQALDPQPIAAFRDAAGGRQDRTVFNSTDLREFHFREWVLNREFRGRSSTGWGCTGS